MSDGDTSMPLGSWLGRPFPGKTAKCGSDPPDIGTATCFSKEKKIMSYRPTKPINLQLGIS